MIFVGNVQLVQKRLCIRFRFPAVELRKFRLELGSEDAVFRREIFLRIERVFLVHDLDEALMPEHDGAHDGLIVKGVLVLHQYGHALVFVQRHLALVRLDLARQHL